MPHLVTEIYTRAHVMHCGYLSDALWDMSDWFIGWHLAFKTLSIYTHLIIHEASRLRLGKESAVVLDKNKTSLDWLRYLLLRYLGGGGGGVERSLAFIYVSQNKFNTLKLLRSMPLHCLENVIVTRQWILIPFNQHPENNKMAYLVISLHLTYCKHI